MTRSIPGGGFSKCALRSMARCGRKNVSSVVRAGGASFEVELLPKGDAGKAVPLTADSTVVGSEATAGLQVSVEGVVAEHAKLMKRNGRLFCTALVGDGDMMADTKTWVSVYLPVHMGIRTSAALLVLSVPRMSCVACSRHA